MYTDTDHVSVFTPSLTVEAADATKGWSARANYLVDAVSGASVDIVSTASPHWTEARQAGGAEASYKPGDLGFTGAGSFSSEPDYLAWAAGGTAMLDVDQKNFTLLAGYAYGHDTIGRSGTPFSVFSRSLSRNAFNSAVTSSSIRQRCWSSAAIWCASEVIPRSHTGTSHSSRPRWRLGFPAARRSMTSIG